jgi:hypothetical protein
MGSLQYALWVANPWPIGRPGVGCPQGVIGVFLLLLISNFIF